ncbi:ground-like domain protein [Necator americanus]|uniref:Ground-like domain protein n=1 Tax=Necator americanus TaxID=51031 RepID=W2T9Z0_NECAM|nr:ground-like domain protein [Necator americanus]ETN78026.1 ground-like domain protein [Necator americanus]
MLNYSGMLTLLLLLHLVFQLSDAFFLIGPTCGCPSTNPTCPPQPGCPVQGVATQQVQPIPVPDELEMRAAAFGVPIGQRQHAPTNLEQFEKLVDRQEAIYAATANPATPLPDDESEHSGGLGRQLEIRRAPAIHFTQQEGTTENLTTEPEEEEDLPTTPIPEASSKCNSQVLKKLMLEQMTSNSSESKRKINVAAEAKFGGNVDVICSRGHFSYVFSSNLYCEASKDLVTCIAFRQTSG